MIGGMTGVLSDVIPFGLSTGNRNYLNGLNLVGLRRSNIDNSNIKLLQLAYEIIFKNPFNTKNLDDLSYEMKNNVYIKKIINFILHDKKRPIARPEKIL